MPALQDLEAGGFCREMSEKSGLKGKSSGSSSSSSQNGTTLKRNANDHIQVQTKIPKGLKDQARPSVVLKLGAPDFLERFTEYFDEHIDGFTGLRGSKRPKSEKELNMEWRLRLKEKQDQEQKNSASAEHSSGTKEKNSKNPSGGDETKKKSKPIPVSTKIKVKVDEKARLEAIQRYKLQKKGKMGGLGKSNQASKKMPSFL